MTELEKLLEAVKGYQMTPEEKERQRISWATGQVALSRPDLAVEEVRDNVLKAVAKERGESVRDVIKRLNLGALYTGRNSIDALTGKRAIIEEEE